MQDSGGERELVLGNKQLLAIFLVAALLCGVFFAVGYVVGGNSAKAGAALVADGSSAPPSEGKHEEPQSTTVSPAPAPAMGDSTGTLPAAEPMLRDNPAATGTQPLSVQSSPAPAPYAPAPKSVAQAAPAVNSAVQVAKSAATGVYN